MRGARVALGLGLIALCVLAGCSSNFGRRPDIASSGGQNYEIKWAAGDVGTYQWQLVTQITGSSAQTLKGHVDVAALSAEGGGLGLVQLSFTIESSTNPQDSTPSSYLVQVDVDSRGKIVSDPDGMFGSSIELHTVLPLLPPRPVAIGETWSDKYALPNPDFQNARDFSVIGKYARDEGRGSSRQAVFQVRLFATFDDSASYESLFGTPPAGAPAHMSVRELGTETADITYWYDPILRHLAKSVAKNSFDGYTDFIDASTNKVFRHVPFVSTESVTFTRSS